jgi:hypothetical protein
MYIAQAVITFFFACKRSFNGSTIAKGVKFGLIAFLFIGLIHVLFLYILIDINTLILFYFLLEGLLECIVYGIIVSNSVHSNLID